jgi:hypothetical protein
MLACFHVQVQYAGQRPKGKHNRSLKVAVQVLVLWPTPYTYIHTYCKIRAHVYMLLNGSDDGVSQSELLGFWTFSIVQYSKN